MIHTNNGDCQKCDEIFDTYPRFNKPLRFWFKGLQRIFPSLHICCAGRGKLAQELAFKNMTSLAHYGESAHNFNAALDMFRLIDGKADFTKLWFITNIAPVVHEHLEFVWYGEDKAKFKEQGHIEVRNWRNMVKNGLLYLVEAA